MLIVQEYCPAVKVIFNEMSCILCLDTVPDPEPADLIVRHCMPAFTNDITLFASRVKGFGAQSLMHMRIVKTAQNSFLISLNIMTAIRIINTTKPARLM